MRADITGDWSAFTGQLNVTTPGSGDFRIAASYTWPGLPLASVNLAASTFFYMSGTTNSGTGTTIAIGALSGASGSHLRGGATSGRILTYRIGGIGTAATFSGDIAEQVTGATTNLVKTGAGLWNLGGPATHRGTTTVEGGTLCIVAGGSITNTASLDVQSGTTLCVNGGSVSVETVTIASGAAFASTGGNISGEFNNSGTATIATGTLTVAGDITNTGTMRVTGGAQFATSGTFSNSGILDLLTSASALPANFVNTGIVIENSERRILTAQKNGANFSVTVAGYTGHIYQLQRTDTLGGGWANIGPALAGTGATLTLTDTGGATGSARFYRVFVSP